MEKKMEKITKKKTKKHDLFEKSALQSKKFLAYGIGQIGLFIVMIIMTIDFTSTAYQTIILLSALITSGAVQCLFLGGQAGLDKYVRIARINAGLLKPIKGEDDEDEDEDETNKKEEDANKPEVV
jgi:hypothetical protein